ncbi:MAG: hypothetical protein EOM91_13500 [Sphingobacteriia bacterium]|nr:hypothetical protein [Sphingobacteriia bacterium]NCC40962.1 hypothetical protein [Gammaproteobacteria bacterium]
MRVESFEIALGSSHQYSERLQVSEQWLARGGTAAGGERARTAEGLGGAGLQVSLSDAARAAQSAEVAAPAPAPVPNSGETGIELEPRILLLARLIEMLTGEAVSLFWLNRADGAVTGVEAQDAVAAGAGGPAAFGFEYRFDAHRSESEVTRFAAQGVVRMADGAEIRFDLALSMERHYAETVSMRIRGGAVEQMQDPLMIDFGQGTAHLSDVRFAFDLDGDGRKDQVPLPAGRGFIAFDRNDNGRIDDGLELFGPRTGHGFAELAELDDDGNGWLDEVDAAWSRLRLWQPDAAGEGRLLTMDQAGAGISAFFLTSLDTPFTVRDGENRTLGMVRATSLYVGAEGQVGTVSQVDLLV